VTTPKQAPLELDSPYGKLTVHDKRSHESFKPRGRQRVARLHFDKLTVNRKDYGDMDVYLAQDDRGFFGLETDVYRGLTGAARRDLEEYFCDSVFPNPVLAPYKEPLTDEDYRASLKRTLKLEILRHLDDAAHKGSWEETTLRTDLVDEILYEALAKRGNGVTYSTIRQDEHRP
jgi:hypothetical protein